MAASRAAPSPAGRTGRDPRGPERLAASAAGFARVPGCIHLSDNSLLPAFASIILAGHPQEQVRPEVAEYQSYCFADGKTMRCTTSDAA